MIIRVHSCCVWVTSQRVDEKGCNALKGCPRTSDVPFSPSLTSGQDVVMIMALILLLFFFFFFLLLLLLWLMITTTMKLSHITQYVSKEAQWDNIRKLIPSPQLIPDTFVLIWKMICCYYYGWSVPMLRKILFSKEGGLIINSWETIDRSTPLPLKKCYTCQIGHQTTLLNPTGALSPHKSHNSTQRTILTSSVSQFNFTILFICIPALGLGS